MQPDIVQYSGLTKDDFINLAGSFGTLGQQHGEGLSYAVSAAGRSDTNRSSSKGASAIPPHSEFPFSSRPPKMLGLWCERPAACGGGATVVMDVDEIRAMLSPDQRQVLDSHSLDFGGEVGISRIYDGATLRYSHNLLLHGDYYPSAGADAPDLASAKAYAAAKISSICFGQGHSFALQRGAAIFWNNHRMLHARERFSDLDRCLHRVTIY